MKPTTQLKSSATQNENPQHNWNLLQQKKWNPKHNWNLLQQKMGSAKAKIESRLQQIWTQFLFFFNFFIVGANSNKGLGGWSMDQIVLPSVKLEWEWDVPLKIKKSSFSSLFLYSTCM
jgi:hypothetical protein